MKKSYKIQWKTFKWMELEHNQGRFDEIDRELIVPDKKMVEEFKSEFHGDKRAIRVTLIPSS